MPADHDASGSSVSITRRSFLALSAAGAGSLAIIARGEANEGPPGDVTSLTLVDAADQVRRKRISPVELTQACLDRIAHLNPTINAFITVLPDAAIADARIAEAEIRHGRWRGPLHGIPIAVKDLFDTVGVRTTAASELFKDRVPNEDAEVIRRLKAAGAVILGKTNMHEFAYGGTSAVSYFGPVRNPWNNDYVAGGSSGGSAAAVAAKLCYGALGTDTAASVRQPAAFCGVVGLKPTYGLVSTHGVIPLSWTLDHVGPFARTVADVSVLLKAIAGYDPLDLASRQMSVADYSAALRNSTRSLRAGVARDFYFDDLDPEISAAINDALGVLQTLTLGVHEVSVPARGQEQVRAAVRSAEAYAYHAEFVEKSPERYQPETLQRLRADGTTSARAYIEARREVDHVRRTAGKVFETVDVIVTPTTAVSPPALAEVTRDVNTSVALSGRTIRNTSPFNVYGWPTISIPCGFTRAGLPIGLQIAAANGQEATLLRLAHAYEQATDWRRTIS